MEEETRTDKQEGPYFCADLMRRFTSHPEIAVESMEYVVDGVRCEFTNLFDGHKYIAIICPRVPTVDEITTKVTKL